jgi:hypothetical protein
VNDNRDILPLTWDNMRATKAAPETLATSRGPEPREILGGIVTRDKTTQPDPLAEYLDACPECMMRDNAPHRTEGVDGRSTNAHYTCQRCGCQWECSWWTGVGA